MLEIKFELNPLKSQLEADLPNHIIKQFRKELERNGFKVLSYPNLKFNGK